MKLSDFDYNLPEELIAQYPLSRREEARLLVVDRQSQSLTHTTFAQINEHLPESSQIVVNNSKVIPARLLGVKAQTGGQVEVFLLKSVSQDDSFFEAMLRPLKKIKEGEELVFGHGISAQLVDREKRWVKFNTPQILQKLKDVGHIPLPPYIKRADNLQDHSDYQTVYAKNDGSVAAPTAGLHFTSELVDALLSQGHALHELTLHVGYGTFKPVEVEDVTQHPMHFESYKMPEEMKQRLDQAKAASQPVVAVGTTSCRVLESVGQGLPLEGETNLFIYPGYTFTMTDILVTNFHLPRSTLLMLVSAFGGTELIRRAYQDAIDQEYRFYSYGDAMLIK